MKIEKSEKMFFALYALAVVFLAGLYGFAHAVNEEKMCFDDEMTKDAYLNASGDKNLNITVPCPPFEPPHHGDESGK